MSFVKRKKFSTLTGHNVLSNRASSFRTCNHYLSIEKGRRLNIPRENRTCNLCDKTDLGDESHFLQVALSSTKLEKRLLPMKFIRHTNILKFGSLMSWQKKKQSNLKKMCNFIRTVNKKISPLNLSICYIS